VTIELG